LKALSPDKLSMTELAGDPVRAALTAAPGNGQPLGGIKVSTDNGWFSARPSGTEDVYKIYAERKMGPRLFHAQPHEVHPHPSWAGRGRMLASSRSQPSIFIIHRPTSSLRNFRGLPAA
jgi:hypothetical protein